ncbi:uncharacterized protein HaLaN_31777, partial [Haematococcus lacustris]
MGAGNKYTESDATAGFFNKYSFKWINPIVSAARKDNVPLEACVLPPEQTADVAYERFRTAWEAAVAKGNPKLRQVLMSVYGKDLFLAGIALQRMTYGCMTVGVSVRAALTNAICRKSFAMASISKAMASDAVSFVASDITKIFDGIQDIHYLWTAPIEAMAILTILVVLVKQWALPGWG